MLGMCIDNVHNTSISTAKDEGSTASTMQLQNKYLYLQGACSKFYEEYPNLFKPALGYIQDYNLEAEC